jgi:hypothetical protein
MWGIPHYLDSRLTDGRQVASLTLRPFFISSKLFLSVSGSHFC